jgi:hypothetical protein
MVDHPGSYLYKPPDYRIYGWSDALAPECRIPPEPKLLEPRSVVLNKRRDKIENAIG